MVTIRQVAAAAEVSVATVSNVLNNKGKPVSTATRERVLQAVRDLGYRPAAAEPWRHSTELHTLGVIAGFSSEHMEFSYIDAVFSGVMIGAGSLHQSLLVFSRDVLTEEPRRTVRLYCDGRCDGVIAIAFGSEDVLMQTLLDRGIPLVKIGDLSGRNDLLAVDVDNEAAMHEVTSLFIERGHRRLALLKGPGIGTTADLRARGFRRACREAGLSGSDILVSDTDTTPQEFVHRLLAMRKEYRPTGLIACTDDHALKMLAALHEASMRVPDDFSLSGFDGDPATALTDPPLTTVLQPYRTIGIEAVRLLVARINGQESEPPRLLLPGELIARRSVGPPPDCR